MMKRKSMKLFLVLGVVLLSLLASGCTPNPETNPSGTEPEPSTIVFHELVKAEDIEYISINAMHWSSNIIISNENEINSFVEMFLKNAQFTGNVEMAGFDPKEVFNTYRCLNISLSITDAEILGLKVSPEGYAYLFLNEQTFYLISPEKLNYDAIVYRKWMEENA